MMGFNNVFCYTKAMPIHNIDSVQALPPYEKH